MSVSMIPDVVILTRARKFANSAPSVGMRTSHGDGRPFMSRGPSSHETEASDLEGILVPAEDSSSDSPPSSSFGSDSSISTSFGVDASEGHRSWLASESTATGGKKPKGVRFVLESQPSTSQTVQTVVMPQDETTETPKFGSGSKWKRAQLGMLNVEYDPTAHFPFNFDSVPMSLALHERIFPSNLVLITGINLFAHHIAQFDMNSIASGQQFDYKATGLEVDDAVKLGLFVTAAEELAKIILKRTSLPTSRMSQPTTPVQPTFAANPDYSKDSTSSDQSAGSADSKAEHYTDRYAYDFTRATIMTLRDHVENIPWISSRLSKLTLR